MKKRSFLLLVFLLSTSISLDCALKPNRGKYLFILLQDAQQGTWPHQGGIGNRVVPMTPGRQEVLRVWDFHSPKYDLIFATVIPVSDGSKVTFTRYVMKNEYIPREQTAALFFPYKTQARYSFFDIGTITGFYRESATDYDPSYIRH